MHDRQGAEISDVSKGIVLSKLVGFGLLAPLLVLIGVFFVGALLSLVVELAQDGVLAGAEVFATILSKSLFQTVAFRSFRIAFIVTVITVVLGYAAAYAIWRSSPRVRIICLALVLFPLFTSVVVRTYAWTTLFSRKGMINTVLLDLGLIDAPLRMLNTEPAVFVGLVQVMLPFAILPIYTILLRVDMDLLRASAITGARGWQTFVHILLPLTKQGTAVASILVFVVSLGFFITPAILGGPRVSMISNLISTEVTTFLDLKDGGAMSLLLLGITIGLLAVASRIGRISDHFK